MSHVAIVTDSASDLPPDVAGRARDHRRPARRELRARELPAGRRPHDRRVLGADDRARRAVPDDRRRAAPGDFKTAFEAAFAGGADAVVCVDVSGDLSGTLKSAQVAARPAARTARSTSSTRGRRRWATGSWPRSAPSWPPRASSAAEIARVLEHRKADVDLFVALDTLEYLKRGGRISGARAAVGTMLSIKPIITVEDGIVENADRVRSRPKARERVLELLTAKPARAGGDPPQHQRRRRRVPASSSSSARASPPSQGPDDADRAVGRAAPRPRLRRRGGHLQALRRGAARPPVDAVPHGFGPAG